jgi:hypothetical protein
VLRRSAIHLRQNRIERRRQAAYVLGVAVDDELADGQQGSLARADAAVASRD